MEINREQAIEILEKFDMFQGQRAGRELWQDKPFEVQEQDIANFSRDVNLLIGYIKELTEGNEMLSTSCAKQIQRCIELERECASLSDIVENYRVELGETRVALAEANNDKRELAEENEGLRVDNAAILETMHTPHKDPEGSFRIKLNVPKGSGITYLLRSVKQIEIDTMGKMADKLKACIDNSTGKLYHGYSIHRIIDQVIKEMLEETK